MKTQGRKEKKLPFNSEKLLKIGKENTTFVNVANIFFFSLGVIKLQN